MERDEIRRSVAELGRGNGRRYPQALRERIVAYAQERLAAGVSLLRVGREIGVSEYGLRMWLGRAPRRRSKQLAAVEQVVIVEAEPHATASTVMVRGPAGLVIEGLGIAGVAELIRRLA